MCLVCLCLVLLLKLLCPWIAQARPQTLHAAGRIPGVTAAALMFVFKYLKSHPEVPREHRTGLS